MLLELFRLKIVESAPELDAVEDMVFDAFASECYVLNVDVRVRN